MMALPRSSPESSYSTKQGDVYGNPTVAATSNQLTAENWVLRAQTLIELEGDGGHK